MNQKPWMQNYENEVWSTHNIKTEFWNDMYGTRVLTHKLLSKRSETQVVKHKYMKHKLWQNSCEVSVPRHIKTRLQNGRSETKVQA